MLEIKNLHANVGGNEILKGLDLSVKPGEVHEIKDLHVEVDGKKIINGLTLRVGNGEVHAIMGPNGSGKSTLAHVLAGRPGYNVTEGEVLYKAQDLLAMAPEIRLRFGLGDGVGDGDGVGVRGPRRVVWGGVE